MLASRQWFERTAITSLLFAVPAAVLVAEEYWRNERQRFPRMGARLRIACTVLCLYVWSIVNIICQWSVSYMVAWPLLGIPLTIIGCGLALLLPKGKRWKMAVANALLLIEVLVSIVPPN